MTLFFPLALQRHADVGGRRKDDEEKLKWTPAGIFSTRNEQNERERERERERKRERRGAGGGEMEFL